MAMSCFATKPSLRVAARPAVAARAKAGNWLPGAASPSYLDGSLPADYGFDPLGLGEYNLQRLRESELIHCRWAMAAVAGCLAVELLGFGTWWDAPLWAVEGKSATYFGVSVPFDIKTVALVELILMAGAEVRRNEESDPAKRQYPGGAFDPLGFSKDSASFETMKVKELKNGRLAMMAFLGFVSQHYVTGKGPLAERVRGALELGNEDVDLQNLGDHLANPGAVNFATNGISLPPSAFPFLF